VGALGWVPTFFIVCSKSWESSYDFFYEYFFEEAGMEIQKAIQHVIAMQNLEKETAYRVALSIMAGETTSAQIAALLVSLRLKGETVDEISGFARAMRERATPVVCISADLVDTCGTGGDGSRTFNVSTLSAFVAAGAGCKVAKHGNRSVSSQCGSADLFMELGVPMDIKPEKIAQCIDENGIGFLLAPLLHEAMKHALGPRREIGVRTIFNILGPLTNPAGVKRQLLGVFREDLTELLAGVLKQLGSEHVLVVHGEDGLDEMTLTGKTKVSELSHGKITNYTIEPEEFGLKRVSLREIQGGSPAENVRIALGVLRGEKGPPRDMVLLNAGAVIYVGGRADSIAQGIAMAKDSIDSGKALAKLHTLREMTKKI